MKQLINAYAERLAHALTLPAIDEISTLAESFRLAWKNKKTIYICGNGGSVGDTNHLANDSTYGF
jgi:D-sedoheptulose 7-phosphate isomerase